MSRGWTGGCCRRDPTGSVQAVRKVPPLPLGRCPLGCPVTFPLLAALASLASAGSAMQGPLARSAGSPAHHHPLQYRAAQRWGSRLRDQARFYALPFSNEGGQAGAEAGAWKDCHSRRACECRSARGAGCACLLSAGAVTGQGPRGPQPTWNSWGNQGSEEPNQGLETTQMGSGGWNRKARHRCAGLAVY